MWYNESDKEAVSLPKYFQALIRDNFHPAEADLIIRRFSLWYTPRWSTATDDAVIAMAVAVLREENLRG